MDTPIFMMGKVASNGLYIKRDDFIPFSIGGNKARKAALFFEVIDEGEYDCVVTYGSSSSNHCRVVSNMACGRGMQCYIISPEEASVPTFNLRMMQMFGAQIITVPVCDVHDTIEGVLEKLKNQGKKPYFIPGGGHGNIGTQAYVDCYNEIIRYEHQNDIHFDFIFCSGILHIKVFCTNIFMCIPYLFFYLRKKLLHPSKFCIFRKGIGTDLVYSCDHFFNLHVFSPK